MCGIAGMIDLAERTPLPPGLGRRMADALYHRGPDEEGFLEEPGLLLLNRRLSIVGLADGRQPITNESGDVVVVFNGELFDYPEKRAALQNRGHVFRTHCDTEIIPHLYEEHGDAVFEHLHGQFAVALWDRRQRRLLLGRDRFGICPLYWTRQGDRLLFSSEIRGLLASGLVTARPDVRGINHLFSFFSLPGPVTCFQGVQLLPPGRFLTIRPGTGSNAVSERAFWKIDFPDAGHEDTTRGEKQLVEEFERVLVGAVERRLRADVPVVSYLSGGVDSTTVVSLASRIRGEPIPTFTIRITDPSLDETADATLAAQRVGTVPVIVDCGPDEVLRTYPRLIWAAEGPVVDTSCAALLLLAREVHARGYKVALTGEGADEWLAGYPWYKLDRLLGFLDVVPGLRISQLARRLYLKVTRTPQFPREAVRRVQDLVCGHNPWLDVYGMMSLSRLRLFSPWMWEQLGDHVPYADLGIDRERMVKWSPLHRGVFFAARVHLAGLLLNGKGDRVAMHNSVETRYPFLDEDVFAFLAELPPRWKLRRFRDKYLLRQMAGRFLPPRIAHRAKAMFRAPFDSFHLETAPPFVQQLLSEEALRQTGYFDATAVARWRKEFHRLRPGSPSRLSVEMGLVGVLATQLWHHTYIQGGLADLPSWAAGDRQPVDPPRQSTSTAGVAGASVAV